MDNKLDCLGKHKHDHGHTSTTAPTETAILTKRPRVFSTADLCPSPVSDVMGWSVGAVVRITEPAPGDEEDVIVLVPPSHPQVTENSSALTNSGWLSEESTRPGFWDRGVSAREGSWGDMKKGA